LIPLIKSLTVTYSITKSGGAPQSGTIINALTTNSYIKSTLSDTTPITGVVLLKSSGTNGYTTNYTFTDGTRNAYLYWDSNIGALTTGDSLTINVYYTNNNTSINTASKPSLNFVAAGTPSAPVYRSSTPSTTSVTITIGNPQYGDANNISTNTLISKNNTYVGNISPTPPNVPIPAYAVTSSELSISNHITNINSTNFDYTFYNSSLSYSSGGLGASGGLVPNTITAGSGLPGPPGFVRIYYFYN
jgi:hypothetical protein